MDSELPTPPTPDISGHLELYESMCLSLVSQACLEVRRHLPGKRDLESSDSGCSFAYVAGGWVRDKVALVHQILKQNSKDIDIIVAPGILDTLMKCYQKLLGQKKFELAKQGIVLEYLPPKEQELQAGTCTGSFILQQDIAVKKVVGFVEQTVETVEFDFRELASTYSHPIDDLKTRDFTVNGLYYDIYQKTVKDFNRGPNMEPHQGIADIQAKTIRCINSFALTFQDVSRYVRAIRFEVSKGFTIEPELKQHIEKLGAATIWKMSLKDLWSVIKEIAKLLKSDKHFVEGMLAVMRLGFISGQPTLTESQLHKSNQVFTRPNHADILLARSSSWQFQRWAYQQVHAEPDQSSGRGPVRVQAVRGRRQRLAVV